MIISVNLHAASITNETVAVEVVVAVVHSEAGQYMGASMDGGGE